MRRRGTFQSATPVFNNSRLAAKLSPLIREGSRMIGASIAFLIRNLPAVLLVVALTIAAARRGHGTAAVRFLSWVLLLPIGITGLWAGLFHVFFPSTAATLIGWQTSPFQFEVGMADLAIGITACIGFWRDLSFKAAAVIAASIFLLGDAIGHVRQMMVAGNFAPGNGGVPFYTDILCPLLVAAKRSPMAVAR
jgi:hypothetical protein